MTHIVRMGILYVIGLAGCPHHVLSSGSKKKYKMEKSLYHVSLGNRRCVCFVTTATVLAATRSALAQLKRKSKSMAIMSP